VADEVEGSAVASILGAPGLDFETWGSSHRECESVRALVVVIQALKAQERCTLTQLLFDPQQLVVLGDAVGAAH
jgi:hypothetical protein